MFAVAAEVASLYAGSDTIRMEIDSSAAHLERLRDELGERAAELAAFLDGTVPAIYGSGLTSAVAYRWKCQLNENAKMPAFSHEFPELDHNEIVGWEGAAADGARMSAVVLEDRDQHPRERQRIEVTAGLIEPHAAHVARVETEGESRTERLLWAVMLGDLLSLHLAAHRGVDPTPVAVVERLKDELARP
jgi:glucose/mannose-6-phosphate isomerase